MDKTDFEGGVAWEICIFQLIIWQQKMDCSGVKLDVRKLLEVEKSTEIIYVKNDIQYHYIRNGQRLSYRYIEKIIYGIWWLAGCPKSEEWGESQISLSLLACLWLLVT